MTAKEFLIKHTGMTEIEAERALAAAEQSATGETITNMDEVKEKEEIVEWFIYRCSKANSVYMSNEMPVFDKDNGKIGSDGSEQDVCDYGLATFGINRHKDLPFGRVIKITAKVLKKEATEFQTKVEQTPFKTVEVQGKTLEQVRAQKSRLAGRTSRNDYDEDEDDV
jgi:hypothetical protein